MTEPHNYWTEQCEAAEGIENEFGTQQALDYLVGEKFCWKCDRVVRSRHYAN